MHSKKQESPGRKLGAQWSRTSHSLGSSIPGDCDSLRLRPAGSRGNESPKTTERIRNFQVTSLHRTTLQPVSFAHQLQFEGQGVSGSFCSLRIFSLVIYAIRRCYRTTLWKRLRRIFATRALLGFCAALADREYLGCQNTIATTGARSSSNSAIVRLGTEHRRKCPTWTPRLRTMRHSSGPWSEKLLAVLVPKISSTLLFDVWPCGKHQYLI